MAEMVLDCPHCKSQRVGHTGVGQSRVGEPSSPDFYTWNTFFQCRVCNNITVLKLKDKGRSSSNEPMKIVGDPTEFKFELQRSYPLAQKISAPKHTPDNVASNYIEAVSNLENRRFTSAAMMFRKVLESSTLGIDPNLSKVNLNTRIKTLAQNQRITPAMQKWADIIRLEGNEAAHSQDADEETATQLMDFTRLFLTYVFTLKKKSKST